MTPDTDVELVRNAVEGQPAARHALVLRLSPVVQRRICRPLLSSRAAHGRSVQRSEVLDLTQQILLLLFERDSRVLRSWDPERGLSLASFVGLVAEREAKAILRSGRRSAWAERPTSDDDLSACVAIDPHEVRVQLEQGKLECEVAHDPERRFVVAVGAWEVVVKGTRFTVSSGPDGASEQVVVSVEHGLVEVRQAPDRVVALLGAGQRWSSTERSPAQPTPPETLAPPAAPAAAPATPARSAPSGAAPLRAARPAPSARSLFERADAARLAGHAREAAAAFDELRRRFPTDARAGYAAFMLGRIRLDTLGDPSGAAEALAFAIAHPGGGFFLENAEARRVEALAQAGRAHECQAARAQFLSRYPQALRAPAVAKLCADAR
jgi:hypothetical protein